MAFIREGTAPANQTTNPILHVPIRKAKAPRRNGSGTTWQKAASTSNEAQAGKHHRTAIHAAPVSLGLAITPSKGPETVAKVALTTSGRSWPIALQFIRQQNSTSAINAANSPPATNPWARVKLFPRRGIVI